MVTSVDFFQSLLLPNSSKNYLVPFLGFLNISHLCLWQL